MSQPPEIPDPPPVPVLPVPDYAQGAYVYRKPGWLTTLAVFGFIVAIGSMGVGLIGGMAGLVAYQQVRQMKMYRTTLVATTLAMPQAYVAPRGYGPAASQSVQLVLTGRQTLSATRLEQLDAIITDHGRDILGLTEDEVSPDKVQARIERISQLPGGSGPPWDVFELSTGRLEISDTTAVFYPAGGGQTIRSGGNSHDSSGQLILREDQVQAIVARVRELAADQMTEEQAQGLATLLRQRGQQIVRPALSITAMASQVTGVQTNEDGVLSLTAMTGTPIQIDPAGQVVAGGALAGVGPSRAERAASRRMIFYGLENFASAAAGVFLLVACIIMLRQSRNGRPLLRIYALGKIVLALAGAWVWGAFWGHMADTPDFNWWVAAVVAGAGMLFPIAILIALTRPAVKEYYEAM